ncbi:hypothetical protein CHUAL_003544 [Chamberlinius hualienensis]
MSRIESTGLKGRPKPGLSSSPSSATPTQTAVDNPTPLPSLNSEREDYYCHRYVLNNSCIVHFVNDFIEAVFKIFLKLKYILDSNNNPIVQPNNSVFVFHLKIFTMTFPELTSSIRCLCTEENCQRFDSSCCKNK